LAESKLEKTNWGLEILEKLQVPDGWCSSGRIANEYTPILSIPICPVKPLDDPEPVWQSQIWLRVKYFIFLLLNLLPWLNFNCNCTLLVSATVFKILFGVPEPWLFKPNDTGVPQITSSFTQLLKFILICNCPPDRLFTKLLF
jgi:hypothetical protein